MHPDGDSPARESAALVRSSADGSLSIVAAVAGGKALVRTDVTADGSAGVLVVRGPWWAEVRLTAGRSLDRGVPLVSGCLAYSSDGGISTHLLTQAGDGRQWARRLRIDSGGSRRWTAEERGHDGSVNRADGHFADGTATVSRQQLDRLGRELWTQQDVTVFSDGGWSMQSAAARSGATADPGRTRRFTAYGGSSAFGASVLFRDSGPLVPDPDTTITTEVLPNGNVQTTTVTKSGPAFGGDDGSTPNVVETTITVEAPDGSTWIQEHDVDTSVTHDDGSSQHTFQQTWTDQNGETTSHDTTFVTDAEGNASTTEITVGTDGVSTIVTTTVGPDGTGTQTTTVSGPDGSSFETTEPVGATDGSSTGMPGTNGEPGTDGEPGSGPIDTLPHPGRICVDDAIESSCAPIKVTARGAARTRALPYHVDRILSGAQIRASGDAARDLPLADQVGAQLRRYVWAAAAEGGTSAVAVRVTGADAEKIVRAWSDLTLDGLADPVGVVRLAAAAVTALARTGAVDSLTLNRAALATHRLARATRDLGSLTGGHLSAPE